MKRLEASLMSIRARFLRLFPESIRKYLEGLRLEAGDDTYFDNGARNNLRVTFGPTLRF